MQDLRSSRTPFHEGAAAESAGPAPLLREYTRLLRNYLRNPGADALAAGHEMMHRVFKNRHDLGMMADIHHQALRQLSDQERISSGMLERAGIFLAACLAPFEADHGMVLEGTRALRHLNNLLEAELKRVAHALHDEAGQLLALAHIALANLADKPSPESRAHCDEVQRILRQLESELRNLSYEARPTVLDNLGLLPALEFLGDRVSRRTGLSVCVEGEAESRRLPPPVETALYRIVQEALDNASRHARANRVIIRLEHSASRVTCRIQDDGIGFVQGVDSAAGFGLLGIRERLHALGGSLRVIAEPGCGTAILTDIPLGGC
jgi:signal transduction histidine kinase